MDIDEQQLSKFLRTKIKESPSKGKGPQKKLFISSENLFSKLNEPSVNKQRLFNDISKKICYELTKKNFDFVLRKIHRDALATCKNVDEANHIESTVLKTILSKCDQYNTVKFKDDPIDFHVKRIIEIYKIEQHDDYKDTLPKIIGKYICDHNLFQKLDDIISSENILDYTLLNIHKLKLNVLKYILIYCMYNEDVKNEFDRHTCEQYSDENNIFLCSYIPNYNTHLKKCERNMQNECKTIPIKDIVNLEEYKYIPHIYHYEIFKFNNTQTISLIGEQHYKYTENSGSIDLSNYLLSLIKLNPTHQFDIFIEASMINKEFDRQYLQHSENIHESNIGTFISLINDCLQLDKNCEFRKHYPNVRFHYVDYRTSKQSNIVSKLHNAYIHKDTTQIKKLLTDNFYDFYQKVIEETKIGKYIGTNDILQQICIKEIEKFYNLTVSNTKYTILLCAGIIDIYTYLRMLKLMSDPTIVTDNMIYVAGVAHSTYLSKLFNTYNTFYELNNIYIYNNYENYSIQDTLKDKVILEPIFSAYKRGISI